MKLKEKLANDYYQLRPEGFATPTYDFLAGFEMAKEMCARRCGSSVDISKIDNPIDSIINCNLQAIHDAMICRESGEEEI